MKHAQGEQEMRTKFWFRNLTGRDHERHL